MSSHFEISPRSGGGGWGWRPLGQQSGMQTRRVSDDRKILWISGAVLAMCTLPPVAAAIWSSSRRSTPLLKPIMMRADPVAERAERDDRVPGPVAVEPGGEDPKA